eukprot:Sspe_Gene.85631::Locus_56366_Transcript_2_7_Confidence_0.609_Length_376::g.85631::m.85631
MELSFTLSYSSKSAAVYLLCGRDVVHHPHTSLWAFAGPTATVRGTPLLLVPVRTLPAPNLPLHLRFERSVKLHLGREGRKRYSMPYSSPPPSPLPKDPGGEGRGGEGSGEG